VRFPLRLPIAVKAATETERRAETEDISAGGVLFYLEENLQVGSTIEFSISMPGSVLGTPKDVHVNCVGRVVRCSRHNGKQAIAAVIDEYRFERR